MNKITTKFFTQIAKYINTFEEVDRHPAFASQFETVVDAFEFMKKEIGEKKVNILDLGSGLGNILFVAKSILELGHKYVGVENNQAYIDSSRFVDGQFNIINTDLLSKATQKLISNADIVYCYIPMGYNDMLKLYATINHYMKQGAYFMCNDDTNQPNLVLFTKIKQFSGMECCNQTAITIYKKN